MAKKYDFLKNSHVMSARYSSSKNRVRFYDGYGHEIKDEYIHKFSEHVLPENKRRYEGFLKDYFQKKGKWRT